MLRHKKVPPEQWHLLDLQKSLLVSVLALLVGNTAAGLACGLAGSLALAAAAVLGAGAQVTSLKSLDLFHDKISNLRMC